MLGNDIWNVFNQLPIVGGLIPDVLAGGKVGWQWKPLNEEQQLRSVLQQPIGDILGTTDLITGGNGMDMNTLVLFMLLSGCRGGGSMMKMILLMSLLGGSGSGTNPFSSVTPTVPQTPFNIGELLTGLFGTKDGVPTTGSNPKDIVSTAPMSGELPPGFYTSNPDGSYSPTTPSNTWSPIYS